MAPAEGTVLKPGWGRACTARERFGVGAGRTEKLLGDAEQEDAELAEPVPGGAEAAGATFPASPGSRPCSCRCCRLRACCYARLAARRCRLGPAQPLSVPRAGIPTCSECSPCLFQTIPSLRRPFRGRPAGFTFGEGLRVAVGARRVGDVVPARRLQVRAGGAAVPGSAPPGSAPPPRQVPGTSRGMLRRKLPLRNHLRADPRRDSPGSASQPWSLLLGAFWLPGGDNNAPIKSRHGIRAGGADAMFQRSKTREEWTPAPRPGEGGMGSVPLGSLSPPSASCFTANSLSLLQNKTREPKAPVPSVP